MTEDIPGPDAPKGPYRALPYWAALFGAAFTWPLLFVGGLVTTYRVGMAVPDWPTTFGINMFLYDFLNSPWGVYLEHSHRLYGSAVGLACIFLAGWFLAFERRGWMKVLGVVALLGVIGQGVLGGVRVNWNSQQLAAVHGVTGQMFFGLMVALCVFTGKTWFSVGTPADDPGRYRRRSVVMLALILAQIVLGAVLRHFGAWLYPHLLVAVAVWAHAAALSWRIERHRAEVPSLVASSRAMALVITLQFVLGILALVALWPIDGVPRQVTSLQAVLRTAHQANGALLLATSVVLMLRAFRAFRAPEPAPAPSPIDSPRTLEVVS